MMNSCTPMHCPNAQRLIRTFSQLAVNKGGGGSKGLCGVLELAESLELYNLYNERDAVRAIAEVS